MATTEHPQQQPETAAQSPLLQAFAEQQIMLAGLGYLVEHDPLTNLLTGEAFNKRVDALLATDRPIGILGIDLDGFKSVNDNLGHLAGDKLLQGVADWLETGFRRKTDLMGAFISRPGGDEFRIAFDLSPRSEDDERSEEDRLTATIEYFENRVVKPLVEGQPRRVKQQGFGISYGAAVRTSGNGKTRDELYQLADQAMYEHKRSRKAGR